MTPVGSLDAEKKAEAVWLHVRPGKSTKISANCNFSKIREKDYIIMIELIITTWFVEQPRINYVCWLMKKTYFLGKIIIMGRVFDGPGVAGAVLSTQSPKVDKNFRQFYTL